MAQLLGELLLDRANVKVMMRYVGDPANLKLMMILLKDSSRSIQFEAFHVFKAGPPRCTPVHCAQVLVSSSRPSPWLYMVKAHSWRSAQ